MNGDVLCDLDYAAFYAAHLAHGRDVSVSVCKREVKIDFGVLEYNGENQLTAFKEKPTYASDVSMGIYCLNRRAIERLEKGKPYGFDNLMIDGLKSPGRIYVQPFSGYWLDIGRPEDYQYADEHFDELSSKLGIVLNR